MMQRKNTEKRKEEDRLDCVEAELKMNGLLRKILKYVQDRHYVSQKPAKLPISSLQHGLKTDGFENFDDDGYSDVVKYFRYIGGFHLKEAVNLCLKEALTNSLTRLFTWWGREEGY
ncbi:uncharacterized protein [Polyergus mexicanus]|uniref:uncharacterized protein n=1 Tax=Polyergus mexicanus TaxID=615972 RepID=UPI0038B42888